MLYRLREMPLTARPRPLARSLAAASLLTLWPAMALPQVLPTGLNVVGGQAQVTTNGASMTVTNSANAILNWQSFGIGAGASVRFNQPSASSAVLNRVVGNDPSNILGSLSSNGHVWLLNPNGVLFGQGARIDVAGLVTSTLRISDHDWLAGRFNLFGDTGSSAGVINQGELRTPLGGRVALIGGSVRNEGLVEAPGGQVLLAAGQSVELVDTGAPNLGVRVTAPAGEALNLGTLRAAGGRIDIHAAAVNQQGFVSASSLVQGPGGEVVIKASGRTMLADGSVTTATGADGAGGRVVLLGQEVGLVGNASVDVSGARGGGEVLVGGGLQGKDPAHPNARAVYFGPDASIRADATANGDGGRIILWSDEATRAFGSLSARGGAQGGDGGFIETSGGWLDARPAAIDVSAPMGNAGAWLIDPYNIIISDGGADEGIDLSGSPPDVLFTSVADSATLLTGTITSALNAGTNVTVTTGDGVGSTEPGNITFQSATISVTAASPGSFTVIADGMIDATQVSITSVNPLDITFLAGRNPDPAVSGGIYVSNLSSISSGGGDVFFGGFATGIDSTGATFAQAARGGTAGFLQDGVQIGGTINAGAGKVTIHGVGAAQDASNLPGVRFAGSISAADVEIKGYSAFSDAVFIYGSITATNSILVDGRTDGPSTAVEIGNAFGAIGTLNVQGGGVSPFLTINGYSGFGSGVDLVASSGASAPTLQAAGGATITVRGTAASGSDGTFGIRMRGAGQDALAPAIEVTGGGAVTLGDSTSALGTNNRVYLGGLGLDTDGVLELYSETGIDIVGDSNLVFTGGLVVDTNGHLAVESSTLGTGGVSAKIDISSLGQQSYGQATLSSGGGDIALLGKTLVAGPTGTSNFAAAVAAADSTRAGVDVNASTLDAGTGNIFIHGASDAVNGSGVSLLDASVFGSGVHIRGHAIAAGGTGVRVESSTLTPSNALSLMGLGDQRGVWIPSAATSTKLQVQPVTPQPSNRLVIVGESRKTADVTGVHGVDIDMSGESEPYGAPISIGGGAYLEIRGYSAGTAVRIVDNTGSGAFLPTIDLTGGGSINISQPLSSVSSAVNGVELGTVWIDSDGPIGINGNDGITLTNTALWSDRAIVFNSNAQTLVRSGSWIRSFGVINAGILIESAGSIEISGNSWLQSAGGDITMVGRDTFVGGPGGTSMGPAAVATLDSGTRIGVNIQASTIEAQGGNILGIGASYPNDGVGVSVNSSTLSGGSIVLRGNAEGGAGIGVDIFSSQVLATSDLLVSGLGGNRGVNLWGTNPLLSVDAGTSGTTASLRIVGESLTSQYGTAIWGADSTAAPVRAIGANVGIYGISGGTAIYVSDAGTNVHPTIQVGGGGQLEIGNADAATVEISNAYLFSESGINLTGAGQLALNNARVQAGGALAVRTPNLNTGSGTSLTSLAEGDAIVLSGLGTNPMATWINAADPLGVLQADVGRWLVFLTDVTDIGAYPADLPYRFKLYNASPGDGATDSIGNSGLVFSVPQFATLTGVAQTKTYDGTTTATVTGLDATGVTGDYVATVCSLDGCTQLLSITGADYASPNAGTNIAVTLNGVEAGFLSSGGAVGQINPVYGYQYTSNIQGAIEPAPLTVAISVADKVYDATTQATAAAQIVGGLVGSETLGLSGTAIFLSKDVGTAKPLVLSFGLSDGSNGGLASNYVIAEPPTASASITPATLSLTGLVANGKVYDATTLAPLAGAAGVTVLGSDSVSLTGTAAGSFADKNVGTGKPVTVSGLTLTGVDAGNYILAGPTLSADITPAPLRVAGIAADSKVYDATTAITLAGTGSVLAIGDDLVTLTGTASGSLLDKNAGTAKPVIVSGLSLAGADAPNYTLQTDVTAEVQPLAIQLGGYAASNKVYDATTAATLSGTGTVTPVAGDSLGLAGTATGSFADRNVGTWSVTVSGLSLTGADAGNYVLIVPTLLASITPATLLYVADPAFMLLGQPVPAPLTGTVTGFRGSDTVSNATTGALNFTASVDAPAEVGRYPIFGAGLEAINYVFEQAGSNASALTVGIGLPPTVAAEVGVTQGLDPIKRTQQYAEPPPPDRTTTGLVDVVSPLPPLPSRSVSAAISAAASSFGPVDLGAMAPDQVRALFDARDQYKKTIFGESIAKLAADPTLADLPPCTRLEEAEAGTCLVTEARRWQLREAFERQQAVAVAPSASPSAPPSAPLRAEGPVAPLAAPAAPAPATPSAPPAPPAVAVAAAVSPALPAPRRVRSAALPQIERKVAVLIGVDRYTDGAIPSLANAVSDVRAVASVFENVLGYETLQIENATKAAVVSALNRLAIQLRPQDSVVIYYAGHGEVVPATKLGYWQLADADSKRPETWLSNADISRLVAAVSASQVSLISDSCYSGSLITEERIRASTAPVDPVALLTRKTVAIMTSGGNEPVFDSGKDGHSPFAFSLMRTLDQVKAWSPGGRVFERVRFAVAREVPQRPQYGASTSAGHQSGGDYLFEQRVLEQ